MGGVDLQRDLNTTGGNLQTLYARSHLVLASRAAGIEPPIDSVYPQLDDPDGLRDQAEFARSLGFFGKSAIHPRQIDILHQVFTPTGSEIAWAQQVVAAFDAAGGEAFQLPSGEFVDLPVADRARRLLQIAGSARIPAPRGPCPKALHRPYRHDVERPGPSPQQVGNKSVVIPRNGLRPQRLVRPGEVRRVPRRSTKRGNHLAGLLRQTTADRPTPPCTAQDTAPPRPRRVLPAQHRPMPPTADRGSDRRPDRHSPTDHADRSIAFPGRTPPRCAAWPPPWSRT